MMSVPIVAFCGTIALVAGGIASLGAFAPSGTDQPVVSIETIHAMAAEAFSAETTLFGPPRNAVSSNRLGLPQPAVMLAALSPHDAAPDSAPHATAAAPALLSAEQLELIEADAPDAEYVLASVSPTEVVVVEQESDPDETPPPAPRVKLVSLFTGAPFGEPVEEPLKPVMRRLEETLSECFVPEICMDEYLWAAYERTPKIDTNKLVQKIKTTVKRKGKTRTVTKTITKYVTGDFTWKDPAAAQRVGMSLKDYVIGGMDKNFKKKLYYALRVMDEAGHMPGITSAFRDNYRQSIAVGTKAAADSSYHGGSRRGGYGHGMAVDMVSVKGATRMQRVASTVELWRWIDQNERQLGVGRPYRDRDPPHVTPIDGREYIAKRGGASVKDRVAALKGPGKVAKRLVGQSKLVKQAAAKSKHAKKAVAQAKPAQKPVVEAAAQKSDGQARPAQKPTVQAKPAKPVVQAKPSQKPVAQAKPAPKPVVQAKPAPKPVVQQSKPTPKPMAQTAKPTKPAKPARLSSLQTDSSGADWSDLLARLRRVAGG
jgi:hypothetical protein